MAKLSAMAAKKRDRGTLGMSTASGGAGESTPKASPAERNAKGFFAKKKAAAREAAAAEPPRAGSPLGASGAQPWTKKLRPSLQKLRIAGGSKERAASQKRPAPHAEVGAGGGAERPPKKSKHAETSAAPGSKTGKKKKGKDKRKERRPVKPVDESKAREGNNEIAQYANRKMLKEAQACFETAIKKNLANSHTYTIMINAHVRCGDSEGAAKVLRRMCKASLQPCVVAYTTLINGKCRAGDLTGGMEVLRSMLERRPPVWPNVRTVNTMLRGCLLVGGVAEAKALFGRMRAEWNVEPDASTYEYVTALLSQDLRLDEAQEIVDELRRAAASVKGGGGGETGGAGHEVAAAASPSVYVSIARGAALLADWKAFEKACKRAGKALKDGMQEPGGVDEEGGRGGVTGGKQGWRVRDDARMNSAHVFDMHRRDELQRELAVMLDYQKRAAGAERCGEVGGEEAAQRSVRVKHLERLLFFLRRVVSCYVYDVGGDGGAVGLGAGKERDDKKDQRKERDGSGKEGSVVQDVGQKAMVRRLLSQLRYRFGLEQVIRLLLVLQAKGADGEGGGGGKERSGKGKGSTEKEAAARGGRDKTGKGKADEGTAGGQDSKPKQTGKEKSAGTTKLNPSVTASGANKGCGDGFAQRLGTFTTSVREYVSSDGRLDWKAFFGNELPVKLEIASGAGEWAAAQARADEGKANWLTLELRHDRVYQTFTRMVLDGLHNLGVLGGDAMKVLPLMIGAGTIQHICINHPEPPQQTGGMESQGFHLLTAEFFGAMHRVLAPEGKLTIVTDNEWYAQLLARGLAGGQGFSSFDLSKVGKAGKGTDVKVKDVVGGIAIYSGLPGPACGHCVQVALCCARRTVMCFDVRVDKPSGACLFCHATFCMQLHTHGCAHGAGLVLL